jgi:two-component system alkaline phosphatase synthesis response regulator PhoP
MSLMKGKKILIIEDEKNMRLGLRDNLLYDGYQVVCAETGEEGLELYKSENPDLILLDVMLPKMDGIEVCRILRKEKKQQPLIIMLTAKGQEIDKVLGLETGADDYITKPFNLRELLARVKAVLRRAEKNCQIDLYSFGDVEIDFSRQEVRKGGIRIEFTTMELKLLNYLICHKGIPVSRETLLDNVWGYERFPTTRTVDNHVLKLRKKLEDDPESPQHFLTMHGFGYKFVD